MSETTEQTEARAAQTVRDFNLGWILAVSTIFDRTGDDVSCYETMGEAGISWEDLQELDLSPFDMNHMIRIFWHHGLSEVLGDGEMTAGEYIAAQEDEE